MIDPARSARAPACLKVPARRAAIRAIAFRGVKEPRLRFDRTAVGLVRRLQAGLIKAVPDGRTVIVTITAPIRQDCRTGMVLQERIQRLLATRRAKLETTIHGNRIQVRVLEGGSPRTSKLIGFVHNPKPPPAMLFDVTRFILGCLGSRPGSRGNRWGVKANRHGLAPIATLRHVSVALRAPITFARIP